MSGAHEDGELTLKVGGQTIGGWTDVRVTRGIERCPNDFDIAFTELYPGDAAAVVVVPGQPCQVCIGDDPVITGYVDRFSPSLTGDTHALRITGRGKCQDLVDCSAEWDGGQITNVTPLQLAQKLAAPYGITATALKNVSEVTPQFNIMLGETAYEIIERVCRWQQLLAYEGTDGNLVLAQTGTDTHNSGLVQGQNIEAASAAYTMNERYSVYAVFLQSMEVHGDVGAGGNLLGVATDPNVLRHRYKYMVAEAGGGGQDVSKRRAIWEAARRAGRSIAFDITVDSWRDGDGVLWTPNFRVPLELPGLKAPTEESYVIGEVEYVRNSDGTHAILKVMPVNAFNPEPILLQPAIPDVPATAS